MNKNEGNECLSHPGKWGLGITPVKIDGSLGHLKHSSQGLSN